MSQWTAFGNLFKTLPTRATEVLLDETGKPCGIKCTDGSGTQITISAKQVIIATGGFQCNKEMMVRYLGRWADVSQAQCVPYLDGSGIIMA